MQEKEESEIVESRQVFTFGGVVLVELDDTAGIIFVQAGDYVKGNGDLYLTQDGDIIFFEGAEDTVWRVEDGHWIGDRDFVPPETQDGKGKLRSPLKWFGGKNNQLNKLLPVVPPHRIYCEPFGGSAALLFAKEPAPVEVYNDLDSELVNFFRVLRDKSKFPEFIRQVELTLYSREDYDDCRKNLESIDDDVERARAFFVSIRQARGGIFGAGWSCTIGESQGGMAGAVKRWLRIGGLLEKVHKRLQVVQIEHQDFRKLIGRYDTPDTFFYLDPPYMAETRRGGSYRREASDSDHEDLVRVLLELKGTALLSGYRNELYEQLENAGWTRKEYEVKSQPAAPSKSGKKTSRTECLWLSPALLEGLEAIRND